jgi:predicted peroxiredoxin
MATFMISGSFGSDDPTRAVLPLLTATGALEAGHEPEVFLVGEAVYLMKQDIADALNPVGWRNVGETLRELVGKGVQFYV